MIAVIIGCVVTTCATDARGPNFRSSNGLAPYGSFQPRSYNGEMSGNLKSGSNHGNYPQNQMSEAMTQGSNRGNFYQGQQQPMVPMPMSPMQPNRMPGGEQMMGGGQPMENYQTGVNDQMMGNPQGSVYQGNPGMGSGMMNEPMMGNPQMNNYQPGMDQMNPMGGMSQPGMEQMNPMGGMSQPGMDQMNPMGGMNQGSGYGTQGMVPQQGIMPQGMGHMNQAFQPQGNNYGNPQQQQNPAMFNEEMAPEERMAGPGMEPATFGANAAF